jgi:hypothetical protein
MGDPVLERRVAAPIMQEAREKELKLLTEVQQSLGPAKPAGD